MVAELNKQIAGYDAEIKRLANERYPEAVGPRQVNGVGPITSLAYVLIIDDPRRFRRSCDVGSYLGLTPRRDQSGQSDPNSTSRKQATSSSASSSPSAPSTSSDHSGRLRPETLGAEAGGDEQQDSKEASDYGGSSQAGSASAPPMDYGGGL
jgi:transposase